MSLVATYHVDAPGLPLVPAATALSSATIELDRVLTVGDDEPVLILWVDAAPADVASAFDDDPTVRSWSTLQVGTDQSLYRVAVDEGFRDLKRVLVDAGGVPDGATVLPTGWRGRARFPDRAGLAAFRDGCLDVGGSFRTERLVDTEDAGASAPSGGLTEKQRTALELAHERGYFDVPRQASLSELATELGLSTSATSTRLRRAQRRLAERAVDG